MSKKETDPLIVKAELVSTDDEETPQDEPEGGAAAVVGSNADLPYMTRLGQVAQSSFQLGLTAFGDTNLKIALIEDLVVEKGKWVGYETFMELFGLAQALPGPLATQVLMASAMCHAGPFGALVALVMWVLPGASLLTVLGILVREYIETDRLDVWLAGVAPATVALVLFASVNFAKSLDPFSFGLAVMSCFASILLDGDLNIANQDTKYAFPIMMVAGGILAVLDAALFKIGTYQVSGGNIEKVTGHINMPIWGGLLLLQLWLILLLTGILLVNLVFEGDNYNPNVWIFSRVFRIGSVVYGGEESVLPMFTSELVPQWMTQTDFSQGLALTQAAPGSIFNLAAYIGAIKTGSIVTSLTAVSSIYVPSYLFLLAGVPIWNKMRQVLAFKAMLKGVNAVAIGFMGAVCIFLWESSVERASDAMIFVVCLGLVSYYNISAPAVIATAIVLGLILNEEVLNIAQKPYNSDPHAGGDL